MTFRHSSLSAIFTRQPETRGEAALVRRAQPCLLEERLPACRHHHTQLFDHGRSFNSAEIEYCCPGNRIPDPRIAHFRPHSQNEPALQRSEEHTSELQSLLRISSVHFCLNKPT